MGRRGDDIKKDREERGEKVEAKKKREAWPLGAGAASVLTVAN